MYNVHVGVLVWQFALYYMHLHVHVFCDTNLLNPTATAAIKTPTATTWRQRFSIKSSHTVVDWEKWRSLEKISLHILNKIMDLHEEEIHNITDY